RMMICYDRRANEEQKPSPAATTRMSSWKLDINAAMPPVMNAPAARRMFFCCAVTCSPGFIASKSGRQANTGSTAAVRVPRTRPSLDGPQQDPAMLRTTGASYMLRSSFSTVAEAGHSEAGNRSSRSGHHRSRHLYELESFSALQIIHRYAAL